MGKILKSFLMYLVYFMMAGGMALMMLLPNTMGTFQENSFPIGITIMFIGMIGFWIVFFLTKFYWYEDAEYISAKTAIILGFISAVLLCIIQVYIRITYGFFNFFNLPFLMSDYENFEKYQSYLIIINLILSGVMGFSFFSLYLSNDDVGYKYIEKTTYYTDSGFAYDEKYSDEKIAVGGYIIVGLLTTIIPLALMLSPLIILPAIYFLFKMLKHKNKKALIIKYVVSIVLAVILIIPNVLGSFKVPIDIPTYAMLKYEETEDGSGYQVVDVINSKTADKIVIPETRFGKPVTISEDVFKNLTVTYAKIPAKYYEILPNTIEELVISSGTSIAYSSSYYEGLYKYVHLPNLKKLEICDTVTNIGNIVFKGCSKLEEVKLPNKISHINDSAFADCDNLKKVTLPNELFYLGYDVFENCKSLTFNKYQNGCYLGSKDNKYLVFVKLEDKTSTSATIHKDTKFISTNAFYDYTKTTNPIETVTFESNDNLKQICNDAFYRCKNLKEINLPDSVTEISGNAFRGCGLTKIVLPKNLLNLGESVFVGCSDLQMVTVNGNLSEIKARCFDSCLSLTTVILPKSVVSIQNSAFAECKKFKIYSYQSANGITVKRKWEESDTVTSKIYYYSPERPTERFNAWFYDDDGETIFIWAI